MMIIDALHYAEVNHYWYLYRSAVPIFADLELQRGKIQSARHVLKQILPQVARGEDLEQRALVYTVYAKVKMAQSRDLGRGMSPWVGRTCFLLSSRNVGRRNLLSSKGRS